MFLICLPLVTGKTAVLPKERSRLSCRRHCSSKNSFSKARLFLSRRRSDLSAPHAKAFAMTLVRCCALLVSALTVSPSFGKELVYLASGFQLEVQSHTQT